MAPDSLSLGSYEHHHHHLLPQQQAPSGSLPSTVTESVQPRRSEISNAQSTASGGPCMAPTWNGFVHTTYDALMVLEACLVGKLSHIPRRPHDRERPHIIIGGNVFIYEENASGIKRWTDGVTWSPSRIMGNFLVYRELSEPFPAGEKKKAKKRKRGSEEPDVIPNLGGHSEEDRKLVGSLVDSYGFKPNGLIKKTLNVKYKGVNHHIVSYYNLEDVKRGVYKRPQFEPILQDIQPREELMQHQFKVNAVDPEEDMGAMDPFQVGPVMPIQDSHIYNQPPALHVFTNEQALAPSHDVSFSQMSNTVMTQSPHTSLSASCTPVDYYQFQYAQPNTQYLGPSMPENMSQVHTRDDRIDSVVNGGQPHFKSEMSDMSDMPVFTSGGGDNSIAALTHSHGQPTDMFAVHGGSSNYDPMDNSHNWTMQAAYETMSMPQPKRRQRSAFMINPSIAGAVMGYGQQLHSFSSPLSNGGGAPFVT